jgi:hypothetical protein
VAEKGSSNRNFYFEGGSKISVYFSFIFTCLLGQSKWLIATPKKQKKKKPWESTSCVKSKKKTWSTCEGKVKHYSPTKTTT